MITKIGETEIIADTPPITQDKQSKISIMISIVPII